MISNFISRIQYIHGTGNATEHSYRSAFEELFQQLGVTALNEPKREKCGAPDFIIFKDDVVIGHLEAKDLNLSIYDMSEDNKKQQERYKAALPNLIYSNGLDWDLFRDGELTASVTIAGFKMGKIKPNPDEYQRLENILNNFIIPKFPTITNPSKLAKIMAGKANLIKDVLYKTLENDKNHQTELLEQYKAFKDNLIQDIDHEGFADIYSETIVYGMFGASLHKTDLGCFTRQDALELLPKTNPFLRSLFSFLAGYDLDERIAWIIDDLASIFESSDMSKIMDGFGKKVGQIDPFLHFYETFLSAYNPTRRIERGVWYTPEPVVDFIVRAVDKILQTEFGLTDGLADTSKVKNIINSNSYDKVRGGGGTSIAKEEVHRVQILDPATGTGTFLAAIVNHIAPKIQNMAPSLWSQYIEQNLIPRLHGFELLMASYTMCHLKLDMIFTEKGYKPTENPPRLSVYLTNSLEEGEKRTVTLPFTKWLIDESKGANRIKSHMPIMCVIGNPPYRGNSSNNGEWIKQLIEPYKKEPGGKKQLEEKNSKWINDDYVKFIRFAEHMISKTGEGILGFITNHGYLDNPTFRGMRWHLLKSFDRIYVLDLHGNANKKEITPEGKQDQNVFDILQGVAIIIAIKVPKNPKDLAEVHHGELWGSRADKYTSLSNNEIYYPYTTKIECLAPQYSFVKRDNRLSKTYHKGFKLIDFMAVRSTGIVTSRDNLVIDLTRQELINKIERFTDSSKSDEQVRTEFFPKKTSNIYLPGDNQKWKVPQARRELQNSDWKSNILPIAYRPFDTRYILYHKGMVERMRQEIMQYMVIKNNFALSCCRQNKGGIGFHHVFCHYDIAESSLVSNKSSEISYCFPLYLYSNKKQLGDIQQRINFDKELFRKLKDIVKQPNRLGPDEVAVFDYIYGVLHCPMYRNTFSEFLKIDFPYIPWPSTSKEFWDISKKGKKLRKIHLMDSSAIGELTHHPFRGEGENTVLKPKFEAGRIWVNSTQYFENVNKTIWEFNIGGYQPAQKWLQDRKGRILSFDDVNHYWRILKILEETKKVMQSITITIDNPE